VVSAQAFKKNTNFDFTKIIGKETYTKSSLRLPVSNLKRGFTSRQLASINILLVVTHVLQIRKEWTSEITACSPTSISNQIKQTLSHCNTSRGHNFQFEPISRNSGFRTWESLESDSRHQYAACFQIVKLTAPITLEKYKTSLTVVFLKKVKWQYGGSVNIFCNFRFW